MIEKFSIPGVSGIIEGEVDGEKAILLQTRSKNKLEGTGYFEIPAGKIREFENIYECLRREIKEETGLDVKEIQGESESSLMKFDDYEVLGYEPFFCSQNTAGNYPIMVSAFICRVEGEMLKSSDEAESIGFVRLSELRKQLSDNRGKFFPMHIAALEKYLDRMDAREKKKLTVK
ncbi:NUDIX hydrolase [Fusibacter sp. JL216-2]|uniref:NUDIX hydrolase n=1 Tax=Fusibacter sp. JL216-2 TaxID=3071453 RepID=UPI003D34ED58